MTNWLRRGYGQVTSGDGRPQGSKNDGVPLMNPLNIAPKLNTHPHLEESLQRDIDRIRTKVAEMAGLTEQALKASVQALTERSRPFAYSVILRDQFIDELETELNQLCLEFLARHQPVAGHLRFVFAAIQSAIRAP